MEFQGFFSKFLKSRFQPGDGLPYWRERIFNGILLAFFIFGSIAIVPNLIASLQAKFISIFIIDSLIYSLMLFVVFYKSINFKLKIFIIIISIYLLSIFLLVSMGPFGPGLIWMISGSVIVALMMSFKKTLYSIAANILIVFLLALFIHLHLINSAFFTAYKLFDWIAIGLNVVVISSVCSIPVSILIQGLEKTINEEKELKKQLLEKNQLLSEEMEKAKEVDKLKSSFLANLSHEIRTPMNAIAGFSELIAMEENLPKNIKKYSEQIFINSDYLQIIINDIVDISLIEAGQIKIHTEKFSPQILLKEISVFVDSMVLRKKKPNVKIIFCDNSALHNQEIYFDKNHLRQILINFITNALKYTNEGVVEICFQKLNDEFVFKVKDTGIGIPENEKKKIFTRFSRIDHNVSYMIPGMGIGLSIAKGLSDALGGNIGFESEENKGSCFYFSFPDKRSLY